jgi:hypothetical protein
MTPETLLVAQTALRNIMDDQMAPRTTHAHAFEPQRDERVARRSLLLRAVTLQLGRSRAALLEFFLAGRTAAPDDNPRTVDVPSYQRARNNAEGCMEACCYMHRNETA